MPSATGYKMPAILYTKPSFLPSHTLPAPSASSILSPNNVFYHCHSQRVSINHSGLFVIWFPPSPSFSYIGAAVLSTTWILLWQFVVVNGYRRTAGIKYPQSTPSYPSPRRSLKISRLFQCTPRKQKRKLPKQPSSSTVLNVGFSRLPVEQQIEAEFSGTHQNTLENLPIIVIMWALISYCVVMTLIPSTPRTLISGLKYPILAASACALWSLTRIPYTLGYITGDPKKVRLSERYDYSQTYPVCA